MKRFTALLLGLCLLLAGCQSQATVPTGTPAPAPSPTLTPVPEPTEDVDPADARYPETWVFLSEVDFASYEDELSEEDWQALSAFFPVLLEGEAFLAAHAPYPGETSGPLEEQTLNGLFDDYAYEVENPPDEFPLSSFTLCAVTGDGQKDLALYSGAYGGWNCVLHVEDGAFYGVYMPIRWFEDLRENGLYWASGGAATGSRVRLRFEDGVFRAERLANTDWDYFAIGGEEVSEAEYRAWQDEHLPAEPQWRVARAGRSAVQKRYFSQAAPEPPWAQGVQSDGRLFEGLNLDGVGASDDEVYVSIFQYGEFGERITVLRICLGTGETLANVFPVYGPYRLLTGKLFSEDKDAVVLEVSVPGSNYGAVDIFALDIVPVGADPEPISVVRMDTVKGIVLNSGDELPGGFSEGLRETTKVVDLEGSSLQGLEVHAYPDKGDVFYWNGNNRGPDDGWEILKNP